MVYGASGNYGLVSGISNGSYALLPLDIERDAPFAHSWFTRLEGHETLLSMGNAEHEIEPSTLEGERSIMQEFIQLEQAGEQITRMIIVDGKTVGVVWIELLENHNVKPPSVHIMIGDPDYRGRGLGLLVMQSIIEYVRVHLHAGAVYSRHLSSNTAITKVLEKLGFEADGESYADENGLVWQNVKLGL